MGRLKEGVNDLKTKRPDVAKQWHPRNPMKSSEVSMGSNKPAWWLCDLEHEWEATPNSRTNQNSGCPYCSGRYVLAGFNDLATAHPELVTDWSPLNDLPPSSFKPESHVRVRWVCGHGHEWVASIQSRSRNRTGCPYCSGRRAIVGETDLVTVNPRVASEWSSRNASGVLGVHAKSPARAWWECKNGHEWQASVYDRAAYDSGCLRCGTSRPEEDLLEYLVSLDAGSVLHGSRQIIPPKELDFAVPSKGVAVEFNGLYWHTEALMGATYHRDKSLSAAGAGYQLLHVWEDDWRDRQGIVKRMLARKLGASGEERLNARSLEYRQASSAEANDFLASNHIQGAVGGSWRGGLYLGDELVALMVMRKRGGDEYELARFATSAIVRGGHSKLLSRFIEKLMPERIVTFADRGVSDGGVYASCGFVNDGEVPPDYAYLVQKERVHKFNYRKSRFKSDPNLKFEEGLTERQLAELNGLLRIYDAGKTRWVWTP